MGESIRIFEHIADQLGLFPERYAYDIVHFYSMVRFMVGMTTPKTFVKYSTDVIRLGEKILKNLRLQYGIKKLEFGPAVGNAENGGVG